MKGLIKFAIIVALVAAVIIYGKKYIDENAVNINDTVSISLKKYYISENVADLEPIEKILEKNKNKPEVINQVNELVFIEVGGWFNYVAEKYTCDLSNRMGCKKLVEDLTKIKVKIEQINTVQTTEGIKLLSTTRYTELEQACDAALSAKTQTATNSAATNPKTARENTIIKCGDAWSCTDCNGSNAKKCTCEYYNNTKITCPKNLVLGRIVDGR